MKRRFMRGGRILTDQLALEVDDAIIAQVRGTAPVDETLGTLRENVNATRVLLSDYLAMDGTDESALLTTTLAGLSGKTVVVDGPVRIDDVVSVTVPIHIQLLPGVVIDATNIADGASLNTEFAIRAYGSTGASTTVTSDVAEGDRTLSVTDSSIFAVGDMIELSSTDLYLPGATTTITRGWVTHIASIPDGASVEIAEPAWLSLTSANSASAQKINSLQDFSIEGGTILCGGVGSAHTAIRVEYADAPVIRNVRVEGAEDKGVAFEGCHSPRVENSDLIDCTSSASLGDTGYGVTFNTGTVLGVAYKNRGRRCRHVIAGGGQQTTFGCLVEGNSSVEKVGGSNAFDCHEACFDWRFVRNKASGPGGGLVIRGQRTRTFGNEFDNLASNGILVKSYDTSTSGMTGTVLDSDVCNNTGGPGIVVDGQTTDILDIEIINPKITNSANNNISTLGDIESIKIVGGSCDGISTYSGSDGNNIRLTSGVVNVVVRGTDLANAPVYGIYPDGVDKAVLSPERISGCEKGIYSNDTTETVCRPSEISSSKQCIQINGGTIVNIDGGVYESTDVGSFDAIYIGGTANASSRASIRNTRCKDAGRDAIRVVNWESVQRVGNDYAGADTAIATVTGSTTNVDVGNI